MAIVKSSKPLLQPDEILTEEELQGRIGERITDIQELLSICQDAETGSKMSWSQSNCIRNDASAGADLAWDGEPGPKPFVGWVVGWNGHGSDDAIHLSIKAAYAFVPGKHLAPGLVPSDAIPWNQVHQVEKSARLELPSGASTAVSFGEVEAGVFVTIFAGARIAPPWDVPDRFQPGFFTSLSPQPTEGDDLLRMLLGNADPSSKPRTIRVSVSKAEIQDPETRRLSKLANEAQQAWIKAMDALPRNAELVRQRHIHLKALDQDERDKATHWKLSKINEAIRANAENDIDTVLLRLDYAAKSREASRAFQKQLETEQWEMKEKKQRIQRQELEDFDRRRHEW
ncbi:hypothetical protein [Luteolibacter marinus]|uniref:hypothetical protein n=1 Tax=Luteolibacter marinus TaxID=2776705 RepID=UPI001865A534|nr:hypothetical protein [Luteolibacter marinus]